MDIVQSRLFLLLAAAATLPACSWVDSTGRTDNKAPDIQLDAPDIKFDAKVASIEERGTLRVSVVDDSTVSATFREMDSGKSVAASCGQWFSVADTVDQLEDACVDADSCNVNFDKDPDDNSVYLLKAPAVNRPVALQYEILAEDDDGAVDKHVFDMCIRPINDAPDTQSDTYIVKYQQALEIPGVKFDEQCNIDSGQGVLDNDKDDRDYKSTAASTGQCISAKLADSPSAHQGGFSLSSNGGFNYVSDGSLGPSQSDSFSYTADDGDQQSQVTTVTILIAGENKAPVAVDDLYFETAQNTRLSLDADQLADDPEDFELNVIAITDPTHGATGLDNGGAFYEPTFGYSGTDTFKATLSDPAGATVTVSVNVEVSASNQAPEISSIADISKNYNNDPGADTAISATFRVSDAETVNQALQVRATSSAPTIVAVQQVTGLSSAGRGEIAMQALGNGEATITVAVTDTAINGMAANTSTETFKVSISGLQDPGLNNHSPRARNDEFELRSGQTRTFDVSSNDTDEDGDILSYRITDAGQLGNRATMSTTGQLRIRAPFIFGRAYYWVVYEADDGLGGVDTATAQIRVSLF